MMRVFKKDQHFGHESLLERFLESVTKGFLEWISFERSLCSV